MAFCPQCGKQLRADDQFCPGCGKPNPEAGSSAPLAPSAGAGAGAGMGLGAGADSGDDLGDGPLSKGSRSKFSLKKALIIAPISIAFWVIIIKFAFLGNGCSSTEGTLVSKGQPLGDWTFKPDRCKSGQREQFFGAFILAGEDGAGGQIKMVRNAARNSWIVQVTLPSGKQVNLDKSKCKGWSMSVHRTSTTVNDIVLLDGRFMVDCTYPDGSVHADIKLDSCD